VADPRHEPLVEQRVANGVALFASQVRDHPVQVRRLAENVRTEPTHRTVVQLEHRPIPEPGLARGPSQDQPRPAERLRTSLVYLPAARHTKVAAKDDSLLAAEEQVVADRLDPE